MSHRPIQSVQRAFAALEAVAAAGDGLSLKELATQLGCSSPTAYQLAQTMLACGYLERLEQPQRYVLGQRCYELARQWRQQGFRDHLTEAALALVAALPGASFSWCEQRGNEVYLCSNANSRRPGIVVHDDERLLMPYTSMASMIHLAWWGDDQQERYRRGHPFDEFGLARWGSEAALADTLAAIRRDGHFIVFNQETRHCRAAVPVFSPDGALVASLTLDWDPAPEDDDWSRRCEGLLKATAARLTGHLGRGDG